MEPRQELVQSLRYLVADLANLEQNIGHDGPVLGLRHRDVLIEEPCHLTQRIGCAIREGGCATVVIDALPANPDSKVIAIRSGVRHGLFILQASQLDTHGIRLAICSQK